VPLSDQTRKIPYLIIIPLEEEFESLKERCPVVRFEEENGLFYNVVRLGDSTESAVTLVLGAMGNVNAAAKVTEALNRLTPKLVVLIGLAGHLSDDLNLGDLVIADGVNEYMNSSFAAEDNQGLFKFTYSINQLHTDSAIVGYLQVHTAPGTKLGDGWQEDVRRYIKSDRAKLPSLDFESESRRPKRLIGHIASGETVVGSDEFVNQVLLSRDRKSLAVEMEAAGFLTAAKVRRFGTTLIIRGISDRAGDRKRRLDRQGKGSWRRFAMHNAVAFLVLILTTQEFKDLVSKSRPSDAMTIASDLFALGCLTGRQKPSERLTLEDRGSLEEIAILLSRLRASQELISPIREMAKELGELARKHSANRKPAVAEFWMKDSFESAMGRIPGEAERLHPELARWYKVGYWLYLVCTKRYGFLNEVTGSVDDEKGMTEMIRWLAQLESLTLGMALPTEIVDRLREYFSKARATKRIKGAEPVTRRELLATADIVSAAISAYLRSLA
jgi:nucleoside phosphorylase